MDDAASCVAQCDFVPHTPPTSVSVVATGGPSTAPSLDQSLWTDRSMGTSMVLTPPPSSPQLPFLLAAPSSTAPSCHHQSGMVSQQIPLTIHVRKLRVLLAAVIVVVVLITCIQILRRGVVISSDDATVFHNANALRQREDDLNFYFGTAASLVAKLFEVAAVFMLPIVILIMMTEDSMLNDSFAWRIGFLLVQGFCIGMLTNAFSTTYVTSPGPVVTHRMMTARDLVASPSSVASRGLDFFPENATIPRRVNTDTMLRTAMLPAYAKPTRRSRCMTGRTNQSLAARFGFSTSDWLRRVASNGVEMDATLNVTVGDWLGAATIPYAPTLPHNLTTAANLAIHVINFLVDRLGMPLASASTFDPLKLYAQQASVANDGGDAIAFLHATARMLNASLAPQDEFGFFFAPSKASLQFSTHKQGSLLFDALTLTLPFRSGLMQRPLVATQFDTLRDDMSFDPHVDGDFMDANGNNVYQVFPAAECGTRGCWLTKPAHSQEADAVWMIRPEVVAYSRCRATFDSIGTSELAYTACTEDKIVNHSIVVGAMGSTLLADRFEEFESPGFTASSARVRRANITNLRRTLSITVGFLTWRLEDLSKTYNVWCAKTTGSGCVGLWYPLNAQSDVLVDAQQLLADELTTIAGDLLAGQPLVSLVTDLPRGSFLALQNIQHGIQQLTKDGELLPIDPTAPSTRWPCSRGLEFITDSIMFNRWYIDHSLQEAYTAGLFHVFQFGVPHSLERRLSDGKKLIDLVGNRVVYDFIAYIPLKGAVVSFLSGILFLVSVCVVVCAGKRRECTIRDVMDVHRVARVHLVDQFFPKVFLKCTVFDTPQGQSLVPFRIVAMRLHRETPDGDIYVTLPAPLDPGQNEIRLSDLDHGHGHAEAFAIPSIEPGDYYNSRPRRLEPASQC